MMKEMSNTGLALLVVAAIVVSVGGTILSISKIGQPGITGLATSGVGTANLTVDTTASITLADDAIVLGTLGTLQSNRSESANGANPAFVDDFWKVNNDGSVNVSIEVYATNQQSGNARGRGAFTSTETTGGCLTNATNWSWYPGKGAEFYRAGTNATTCVLIRCNSSNSAGVSAANGVAPVMNTGCNSSIVTTSSAQETWIYNWTPLPNAAGQIVFVTDLDYRGEGGGSSAGDNATFAINVTVPPTEPSGAKSQAVTFLAANSE